MGNDYFETFTVDGSLRAKVFKEPSWLQRGVQPTHSAALMVPTLFEEMGDPEVNTEPGYEFVTGLGGEISQQSYYCLFRLVWQDE